MQLKFRGNDGYSNGSAEVYPAYLLANETWSDVKGRWMF